MGTSITAKKLKEMSPIGVILTGGPDSVYGAGAASCDPEIFNLNIPILGICYGMHLICHVLGGKVASGTVGEYGRVTVTADAKSKLFSHVKSDFMALMSHRDAVKEIPAGFVVTARTANCPAAVECPARKIYGVQFHPETTHTDNGKEVIKNFLFGVCGAKGDYLLDDYIERETKRIRELVGSDRVLLGLSGGVDSSVCAALLSRAIPNQLTCVFVDHGFMRKDEGDEIEAVFSKRALNFVRVNAGARFLDKLKGVSEPEKKRKIIGAEFIRVFEAEAVRLFGKVKFLAQGTIYPDVVESGGKAGATIKSHHNVGGLPHDVNFKLVEPLAALFKDEVRIIGAKLGLPEELVMRQPFPGPGLAIRIIGEITAEKLNTLRDADAIVRAELAKLDDVPNQYFAVLTDTFSVGVKGDDRTYDRVVAVRAVKTDDFMTASYAHVPHEVLSKISERITSEVRGVSRVVYDITGKPPGTVEWE